MVDQPKDTPLALIELAIEPVSSADCAKLQAALVQLAENDGSFSFNLDPESGQCIIRGVSEDHLDRSIDALKRDSNLAINIGQPQVAYRETITRAADIDYSYQKHSCPSMFARVKLLLRPVEAGGGFVFENSASDKAIPGEYIGGIEKGVNAIREAGLLVGFPIIDFKIELYDGAYHDIDSSPRSFEIAARTALRENKDRLGLILLEPIMKVSVMLPMNYAGNIVGDLARRCNYVEDQITQKDFVYIRAEAPLRHMFGFNNALRSLSEGKGEYEMEFSRYACVPKATDDDPPPIAAAAALRA